MPLRRSTGLLALLALTATPLALLPATAAHAAGPTVFVNELHYDNDGADAGEFVEVAGPAGTDLAGWSLVLYNGNGGAAYGTVPLNGALADQSGGYGTAAFATTGLQNGSPDGLALVDAAGAVVQFLSYEGAFTAVGGPAGGLMSTDIGVQEGGSTAAGASLQLTGTGTGYADFTWTGPTAGTPGAPNAGQVFGSGGGTDPEPEPDPEPVTTLISQVQGDGPTSPLDGQAVTVEGVVTSLFESRDVLDGFFLQEEDADADASAATSEGLFVFCRGRCPQELAEGDLLRLSGTVDEFFGMTQIALTAGTAKLVSSGNPLPTATEVALPAEGSTKDAATFEPVEGMLVTFSQALAVSEYFALDRFGQLTLTAGDRPYQFTQLNAPSTAGYAAHLAELERSRIVLDDDNNDQNDAVSGPESDEPYPYPEPGLSIDRTVRGGDTITGLTGVMHWSFAGASRTDAWRIRPVASEDYVFTSVNARTAGPDDVGGRLTVASFNVLNYFATIDTGGAGCGPLGTLGCRGADSEAERERQLAKIVAALTRIDADVVGLIEVQNDQGEATQQIVDALNTATAPGTYAAVETGAIGTDAIKQAFVYQPASVRPAGAFDVLTQADDERFVDDKNRPALIQTFDEVGTGERFTVAVNHFKSKGSDCDDLGDPDKGDGAGNCDATRTQAAQALADHLAGDPTGSGDPDVLVIGDLNSYSSERPISTLEDAGYVDLLERFEGLASYGYLFDGQLGHLDHALASPGLAAQVTGAGGWHVNADEVPLLDYDDAVRDPGEASFERESAALPLYAPDPYRSSDHDPVVVGLALDRDPVADAGGPYLVRVGRSTTLDASGSTDPDGDVLTYAWDLDGDGAFDDATGATTTFTAGSPGSYPVAVEVRDGSSVAVDETVVEVVTPGRGNGGRPPGRY